MPVLAIEPTLRDSSGDGVLTANERAQIDLHIRNSGHGPVRRARVTLGGIQPKSGVRVDSIFAPRELPANETTIIAGVFRLRADEIVNTQTIQTTIYVLNESDKVLASTPFDISVVGTPIVRLEVTLSGISTLVTNGQRHTASSAIERGIPHMVTLAIRNSGNASGRNVSVAITSLMDSDCASMQIPSPAPILGEIRAGEEKELMYVMLVKDRCPLANIGIQANIREQGTGLSRCTVSVPVLPLENSVASRAERYIQRWQFDSAIGEYQRLIEVRGPDSLTLVAIGQLYHYRGKFAEGREYLERALKMGSVEARRLIGEIPQKDPGVKYEQLSPNPFAGFTPPIGIAMLGIQDEKGGMSSLSEVIYEMLTSSARAGEQYTIHPLRAIQRAFGRERDFTSPSELRLLHENDISFAVRGTIRNIQVQGLRLEILRTRDGAQVFEGDFRRSRTSDSLADAMKALLRGEVPLYIP